MDLNKISLFLISALSIFAVYCALTIGLSWDEAFHHLNGNFRADYVKSLGKLKNYNVESVVRFYPGLYDTIHFVIANFFVKILSVKYLLEIKHLINITFSFFTLYGLFLISKKLFNKQVGYFAVLLCIANPFFFGHMSMNPKDAVICFPLIWFAYYTYCYCQNFNIINKKSFLYLIGAALFMGLGLGIRPTFIIIAFPIIFSALIYILKNSKYPIGKFSIKIVLHIFVFIIISIFLMILTWPQIHEQSFPLLYEVFFKSLNWFGPTLGLLNGEFYETANTPRTFFLTFFLFRMPIYILLVTIILAFSLMTSLKFYKKKFENFTSRMLVVLFTFLFPLIAAIILKVKIYDGIRLFLFIIPTLSLLGSLGVYYVFENFQNNKYAKIIGVGIAASFLLFLSRFIMITPYHYDYSNFLYFKFSNTQNLYEHDYWGTSYKELIKSIDKKTNLNNIKVTTCAADTTGIKYLLNRYMPGKAILVPIKEADYIMMINRLGYDTVTKQSCFDKYPGEEIITVKRLGVKLSVLRKLEK